MWNKTILVGILFLFLISGCAVKKTVETTESRERAVSKAERKRILKNLEINRLDYISYSGKAKTKLSINNKSFNATLNLRIKHNEAIWASVTAFMGIEVARILITPSRIQIINRLQGSFVDKPFDYIYNFTSKELRFEEVEDLLVGNTMYFVLDPDFEFFGTSSGFGIEGAKQDLTFDMQFNGEYRLSRSTLVEEGKTQTLLVTYGEFEQLTEQVIPRHVQINLKAPKLDLHTEMSYTTIQLNEELSLPFSVPKDFKSAN